MSTDTPPPVSTPPSPGALDSDGLITSTFSVVSPEPVKPGVYTSEFWFGFAAKLLGGAYAAGFIGDGTMTARIAGLAVVVLAYFGYVVSRTVVKNAALAVLAFGLFAASLPVGALLAGCSSPAVQQLKSSGETAADAALDCAKRLAPGQLEAGLVQLMIDVATYVLPGDLKPDWNHLAELAIADGTDIKTCAIAEYHAVTSRTPPSAPPGAQALSAPSASSPTAAALARIKAARGVRAIVTPGGSV